MYLTDGCKAKLLKRLYFYFRSDYQKGSNRPQTETIMHTVLKFQADGACLQKGEAQNSVGKWSKE